MTNLKPLVRVQKAQILIEQHREELRGKLSFLCCELPHAGPPKPQTTNERSLTAAEMKRNSAGLHHRGCETRVVMTEDHQNYGLRFASFQMSFVLSGRFRISNLEVGVRTELPLSRKP
jgi:hypothetical protein